MSTNIQICNVNEQGIDRSDPAMTGVADATNYGEIRPLLGGDNNGGTTAAAVPARKNAGNEMFERIQGGRNPGGGGRRTSTDERMFTSIRNRYNMSMGHLETLLTGMPHMPSIRSQRRMRLNIVLSVLLLIIFVLLLGLCGLIYYEKVYLPEYKRAQLQKLIRDHAAAAKVRAAQCKGIDWQTACARITAGGGGAGARRRLYTGNYDRSEEISETNKHVLYHADDPSITYDNFCLVSYRMNIFDNITFPYYASSRLASGGDYSMALLIQHGAIRNAEQYFCSFEELMRSQTYRNFHDILVIAPRFNYEHDELVHPNDVFWNATKPWGDWRVGAESDPKCCGNEGSTGTPKTFSSYEVLDHILATLTDKKLFPNMNKISFVGHSAGK